MARCRIAIILLGVTALLLPRFVAAQTGQTPFFSTGAPDGRIGMASRPGTDAGTPPSTQETEAGDDFILASTTTLGGATFTGLLPPGTPISAIQTVTVEIYRVFPKDSDVTRTSGPPVFSTSRVPTRANSPSDVEFDDRSTVRSTLTFATQILSGTFAVANSVDTGIHPKPNQTTGGDGPVTGEEVQFSVKFTTPFSLPADHYFFVPQVALASGHFLWLSAPGPAVFAGDLQAWIRNADLDPDWLRVGTDIVGGAARFNASFALFTTITLPAATTTTLQTSGTGSNVTLTATVSGCTVAPTGSVLFFQGATLLGVVRLNGGNPGVASLATTATASVTAIYTGDANCAASNSGIPGVAPNLTAPGILVLPPVTTVPSPATSAPATSAPPPTTSTPPTTTSPAPTSGVCPDGSRVGLGQMCPAAATGTPPSAPNQPQATALGATQVRFDWNAVTGTPAVTRYYLYTWDGSAFSQLITVDAPATTYTAMGLTAGSYICATVSAANAVGASAWSSWGCTTTPGP